MVTPLTTGISAVLFSVVDQSVDDPAACRSEQEDCVRAAAGSVVDDNGVGVMAAFDCPHAALRAARSISETCGRTGVRVGVSFGEVTVGDDARVGEAVVQAARLSESASAGQVLVSEALHQVLRADGGGALHLVGVRQLKGVPEPVGVFELRHEVPAPPDPTDRWQAIVSVDMVESSSMLTAIGEQAMLEIRSEVRAVVDRALTATGGVVVSSAGDGFLALVPHVSGAVAAADRMHREIAARNLRIDVRGPVSLRIGVSAAPVGADAVVGSAAAEQVVAVEKRARPSSTAIDSMAWALANQRSRQTFGPSDDATRRSSVVMAPRLALPAGLVTEAAFRFVGRDRQLRQLREAWRDAATSVELTVVSGEPGIGKTRLAAELAAEAAADGAAVLYGVCDADIASPYQPFVVALRGIRSLAEQGLEVDAVVLESVLSALDAGTASTPTASNTESAARYRGELFDDVASVLEAVAAQRPLLLVLDDLHWADRSTVQLLQFLQGAALGRTLVVSTFRDAEVDAVHPMQAVLADHVRRLALDGLAVDEVIGLLSFEARLDDAATALAERVHRETNGSPFFTAQLLREMTASGTLRQVDGVWTAPLEVEALPVSESVRGVVNQRLARLGDSARTVLTVASVTGLEFELDVVAGATDSSFDATLDVVEEAARIGLVHEGDVPGTFRFGHAIVRAALLDELSATRRAQAHRRVAEALERLPGSRVEALAHHWLEASTDHDRVKAIGYLRQAAQRDANALAWEAAAARCRQVIDLLEAEADPNLSDIAETWLAMGRALRADGDLDYLPTMEEAARRARRAGRADLLAHAAMGCLKPGTWFANANETDEMLIGLCEDALFLLPVDDPLRVRVLSTLATNLTFLPEENRDRREKLVDEATALARSIGDVELLSAALVAEYLALWDPTTFERRRAISEELQLLARRTGDDEVRFLAGFFRASCLLEAADLDAAVEQLDALDDALASTENFWFQFLVERVTNAIGILQCHDDMAARIDGLFERSADTQADGAGTWAAQHGGLAIQQGRFASMVESLTGASERAAGQGIWHHALVRALVDAGDVDRANDALDDLGPPPLDFMWLVSMQFSATAASALGRTDHCRALWNALLPYRGRLGVVASGTLVYELVSTTLARLALALDRRPDAEALLREALADAERLRAPHLVVTTQMLLAQLLAADEANSTEAQELAALVAELADQHGFTAESDQASALLH